MQTLVFNTTTKIVKLLNGHRGSSIILETFENVPTVKVLDTYYEVMQKVNNDEYTSAVPVLRVPISNTNMLIVK